MKKVNYILGIIIVFILSGCSDSSDVSDNNATYRVTVNTIWDNDRFPLGFPSGNDHFSPLVGVTHDASYNLFIHGNLASEGVVQVAETGGKSIITNEITNKINDGSAKLQIDADGLSTGVGTITTTFNVDRSHPYVSFISMIAPSPDWFIGINKESLLDDDLNWKNFITKNLSLYDAGSEEGGGFSVDNLETNPQEAISLLSESNTDFENGVKRGTSEGDSDRYVGTITIKKIN